MKTEPITISDKEWEEITNLPEVLEAWGWTKAEMTVQNFKSVVYGVKFDFVSGSPGYVGDLFILLGDALSDPMTLIRDDNTKKLKVL